MPSFTHGYYVYFNDIDETPKHYHKIFIKNNEPHMTTMAPKLILRKLLIQLPTLSIEKCLFCGYNKMIILLQNYQEFMCGTKKIRKRKT